MMLNEAAGVAGLASQVAQAVLQGREGANRLGKLHDRSPDCRRQMDPGHPAPAQGEEPAQADEEDEPEMEDDEEIRQNAVGHKARQAGSTGWATST